ncbi:MAG: PilN domain-containing protein [Bacteriovoracaceae bacterium]|nr:PilN domain-containing protein [Bacteriovoracaceae bacterium]
MIQINLKSQAAQSSSFLGDFDLSKINFKYLAIGVVFYTFAPGIVKDQFVEKQTKIQKKIDILTLERKALNEELDKLADIETRIEKMKKEEEDFNSRLKVVQKVLESKQNPMHMLHFIAKNIPEDVWLQELKIENNVLEFKGNALNYDSIGKFIAQLKDSIFFDKNVSLENYTTKDGKESETRYEEFSVKATIARYE